MQFNPHSQIDTDCGVVWTAQHGHWQPNGVPEVMVPEFQMTVSKKYKVWQALCMYTYNLWLKVGGKNLKALNILLSLLNL